MRLPRMPKKGVKMNETIPSINSRERPGVGTSLLILAGIILLIVALLFGIHLYISEVMSPEIKQEERLIPAPDDLSGQTSDQPAPLSSKPDDAQTMHLEVEGREDVEDKPESGDPTASLPALDESDGFVRDLLASLSGRPEYMRWIGVDELIRKIAMVADNLSSGAILADRIRHLAPQGQFSVIEKSPDFYVMDPGGYHRYDIYSDTFASLDLPAAFKVYRTLEPLLDSACRELGYPEGNFEPILRQAISHLLEAPVLSGEVALVRPSVVFRFADPELESLSPAQKQLVRMGPRNTRIIQSVLRDFLSRIERNDSETSQGEIPEG